LSNGELYDNFGFDLAGGPDVDGDGVGDLLVGAPDADAQPGFGPCGAVFLYSGASGALLRQWTGSSGARLGATVQFVGDCDADGLRDVAVTAPGIGAVLLYSSRTGALLHEILAPPGSTRFGASIEEVGDITGDSASDIAIGDPPLGCTSEPRFITMVDGGTGRIFHLLGQWPGCGAFGEALASIEDLDGDGRRDLAIASSSLLVADTLFLYSTAENPSGDNVLRAIPVDARAGDRADGGRWRLASAVGIDGTSGTCIAIGSPEASSSEFFTGALAVYSVETGSYQEIAQGATRHEELGFDVSPVGDMNGDGRPDILVSAPGASTGSQGAISGGVAVYGFADVVPSSATWVPSGGSIDLASPIPLDVYIEGESGSYSPVDIVSETVRLRSASYMFRSIPSTAAVPLATADYDGDGTLEFLARFSKSDLREMFRYARQPVDTMSVLIEADLHDGRRLQATLFLTIETPSTTLASVIPNPVPGAGQLTFRTSQAGQSWLRVFDIQGRLIATPLSGEHLAAGIHDVLLGGAEGEHLPSGVYYYRLETPDARSTGRFVVAR
jgi:hypothetical protein